MQTSGTSRPAPGTAGQGAPTSDQPARISVVIPVYNEDEQDALESCLREVKQTLEAWGHPWEIIFVDDCSRDQSLAKLLSFLGDERITVIEHTRNLGAVKAILSGMRASRGDIVIPFDPDLQFPPSCIPLLAGEVLEGFDFAGGIRVGRKDPPLKRLSSYLGSRVINQVMRIRQDDFGSIKAYSRKMVEGILSLAPDHLAIQAAAFSLSRHFREIPIEHRPRTVGKSKFTLLMRLDLFLDIYATFGRHPLSLMLLGGLLLALAGVTVGAGLALGRLILGWPAAGWVPGTALAAVLFFFGLNFVCLSLVGQFAVRAFRRSSAVSEQQVVRVHRGPRPGEERHEP